MSAREEASRRFVADMSHELRTPLTAITAVTEVLEDGGRDGSLDPMIEPAVRLVVSETRRLNDLVENLMEVTRFDAGTARLVLDDVDIADQITACIDARAWLDAVDLDAERGIMARLDPRRPRRDPRQPDRQRAQARRFAGTGVGARPRTTSCVIEVQDHGPGIPEDVLPHVFDRFYKASASRPRSEGSGLGLSIAMENAHIHGGDITAANSPKGGAVFTLRLPRDPSALTEKPAEPDGATSSRGGRVTNVRGVRAVRGVRPAVGGRPAGRGARACCSPAAGSAPPRSRRTSVRRPPAFPCSLSEVGAPAAPDAAARTPAGVPVQVFLLCGSQLVTVDRSVRVPDGTAEARRRVLVAQGLLDELARTPSASENEAGYTTDVRGGMSVSGPGPKDPEDALRLSTSPGRPHVVRPRPDRLHVLRLGRRRGGRPRRPGRPGHRPAAPVRVHTGGPLQAGGTGPPSSGVDGG